MWKMLCVNVCDERKSCVRDTMIGRGRKDGNLYGKLHGENDFPSIINTSKILPSVCLNIIINFFFLTCFSSYSHISLPLSTCMRFCVSP